MTHCENHLAIKKAKFDNDSRYTLIYSLTDRYLRIVDEEDKTITIMRCKEESK